MTYLFTLCLQERPAHCDVIAVVNTFLNKKSQDHILL